jgi:hypothetical protein
MARALVACVLVLLPGLVFAQGDEKRRDAIADLASSDAKKRAQGAESLGEIGKPEDFALLEKACADPDAGVRSEALASAVKLGGERALPVVEKALEDPAGGSPIPSFLDHVQSLSDAAGFKPMSLRYVRQDKYEAYSELRFELKARAPLSQLQDFLVKMTASVYYLRVHAITLNPRDDGTVEAEFSLVGLATKEPS